METTFKTPTLPQRSSLAYPDVELCYGLRNGSLVHINEVEYGLACDCICPHCKAPLIARKGDIRTHHFAHHTTNDCGAGPETALHMLAKQIIATEKRLLLPAQVLTLTDERLPTIEVQRFAEPRATTLKQVEIEPSTSEYRPDLSAVTTEGECLDIEIRVTHEVDALKEQKVRLRNRTMIEIDLSALPRDSTAREVEHAVLWLSPRHFVFSNWQDSAEAELKTQIETCQAAIGANLPDPSLAVQSKEHVMLLGHKFGSGYSRKYQSNFQINHLFFVTPTQQNDTANFSIKASAGFEPDKIEVAPALLEKLQQLNYPCSVLLHRSIKPGMRRQTKWIVTDIELE